MRATFLAALCCLVVGSKIFGQTTEEFTIQNILEGLPSMEVYSVLQDNHGFIWCATDRGISRYDGHLFYTYGIEQGLRDPTVFKIVNSGGYIWFKCYNGDVGYIKDFEVKLVKNYPSRSVTVQELYPLGENIAVSWNNNDFNVFYDIISPEGEVIFRQDKVSDSIIFEELAPDVPVAYGRYLRGFNRGILVKGKTNRSYAQHQVLGTNFSSFIRGESLFYFIGNTLTKLNDEGLEQYTLPSAATSGSLVDKDSVIWLATYNGLFRISGDDFENPQHLLPNKAVSSIAQDPEGNYWVSTLNSGLYFLKQTNIKTLIRGDVQLVSSTEKCIDVVFDKNRMALIDPTRKNPTRFTSAQTDVMDMHCYEDRTYYTPIRDVAGISDDMYEFVEAPGNRFLRIEGDEKVLINKHVMLYLKGGEEKRKKIPNLKPAAPLQLKVTSDSSFIMSRTDGLYEVKYRFGETPRIRLLTEDVIRNFVQTPNWNFAAIKGKGIVVYDTTWNALDTFSRADGLSSNFIADIISYNDKGTLFIATSNGIDVVKYLPNKRPIIYHRIDVRDGLLHNDVKRLHIYDNALLIATREGLQEIEIENLFKLKEERIILNIFRVNDVLSLERDTIQLNPGTKDIKVDFTGLSYSEFVTPIVEYRIPELDLSWKKTRSRTVEYANLGPGYYTFQLRVMDSEKAEEQQSITMEIQSAYYETAWFKVVAVLLILLLTYWIWHIRSKAKFRRLNSKLENAKLRQVALATRLNPHFLFNTLGGLQALVLKKDTDTAVHFITRFSALMRHLLKRSGEDYTILSDEIQFIDAFLEIENIKSNMQVELVWSLSEEVDIYDIQIPSMFLQPLVENSMKHGFVDFVENGKINISISILTRDLLKIVVEDNGKGYQESEKPRDDRTHSSEIIENRIKLMQSTYNRDYNMKIENLNDLDLDATGTRITLILPFVHA